MTTFLLLPLVLALAPQGKLLTLEQASGRGEPRISFSGSLPRWRWASDGVHLTTRRDGKTKWVDPITFEEMDPPETEEADEEDDPLAKLIHSLGDIELEDASPDRSRLAFVQENDLFVVDVASGERRAITADGSENVFNGKLDWVYQEEVYGRGDFKAFWWSPDSKHIAFLRLDESDVHTFTVVDHIEKGHFRVKPEITKYPKPGDPNPTVKLGVAVAETGAITWVDLSKYAEDEPLVVRVGWTPGGQVLYMVQDRIQTWLELNVAEPATGKPRTILRETSNSWTYRARPPRWLDDGTFLWMSDRTGYRHVYHYRLDGELIGACTAGEWQVSSITHVDEEKKLLWFTGTKDGAVNSNTYRVGFDGKGLKRLTQGDGRHSVSFNEARTMFIDRYSSLAQPPRVRLCDAEGKVLRSLDAPDMTDFEAYATSRWELHEIEARDGFPLDVALLKPVPFDPSKSYPVWLPTYSGPNSPTARNSWNSSTWYQFLAQNGIIVFQVNVRTASGKGLFATEQGYKRFGIPELRDLEDAVAWLTAHPWADASRVGISGHSYGGFMTAFALTHSDDFALGIAGSGVYDWAMYDTIYTERYMSTPQLNPEGYKETSVIEAAGNLKGRLVLTHGTMDDNVHMQNCLQLVYALQKAGKSFDLMLYPQSRHGIRNREQRWHRRQLEWDAIREELLEPAGP